MWRYMLPALLAFSAFAEPCGAAEAGQNGWRFVMVRDETASRGSIREDGLVIAGNGEFSDGRWVKKVELPKAPYVSFCARYRGKNIEMAARNVVANVVWLDEKGKEIGADFAATTAPPDAQGWRRVIAIFKVPAKAKQAEMELRLRWSPQGEVEWRDAELKPTDAPAARVIKVASVNHRPRSTKS